MSLLVILASILPAYLLGGLNGAIITSKLFYREDIREFGSGNPGLTNFYRVYGGAGSLLVIAIDVMKTVTTVLLAGWLLGRFFELKVLGRALAGLFAVVGHCFPLYHRFRGGKGIMAAGTAVLVLDWRVALITWGTFILILILFKYVSLASIVGSVAYPLAVLLLHVGGAYEFVVAALCTLLLIVRHKGNIQRLLRGEESKLRLRRKV